MTKSHGEQNGDGGWREKRGPKRRFGVDSNRDFVATPPEGPKLGPEDDPFGIHADRETARKQAAGKGSGWGKAGGQS